MSIVKTEIRVDYVGEYRVYTYADGHTETSPAGRPQSREDVQRLRKAQLANAQAFRATAADQQRASLSSAQQQATAAQTGTADQLDNYRQTAQVVRTLAQTSSAPAAMLDQLTLQADLGGGLVGEDTVSIGSTPRPAEGTRRPLITDGGIR